MRRIVRTSPPNVSWVRRKDRLGTKILVALSVPLGSQVGVSDRKVVCTTHQHAVAIRTTTMTVGSIVWRGEVKMLRMIWTSPPHIFALAIGDFLWS